MKKLILLTTILFCFLLCTNAQPGKPDSTFGKNGVAIADFNVNIPQNNTGKQALVQPDGSLLIIFEVAGRTIIAKRFSDGSPDVNYGRNGFAFTGNISNGHAVLQADGKLVVAGPVFTKSSIDPELGDLVTTADFGLARFNVDGSLDNTFGTGGKVITGFYDDSSEFPSYDYINCIAIAPDGKIVVGGFTYDITSPNVDFAFARYNTDGSLDKTFDSDGRKTFDVVIDDFSSSIAIGNDGKIVVISAGYDLTVLRFNVDGSPDTSFSEDGIQNTEYEYQILTCVAIQSDKKIVLSTGAPLNNFIFRYDPDGNFDSTFSEDGQLAIDFGSDTGIARSIIIQPDGKLLVSGSALIRYNVDGSPDNTFGIDGKQMANFEIFSAVYNNGKILTAGALDHGTHTDFALARYNSNGGLDLSLDTNGILQDHYAGGNTIHSNAVVQSDGKIITVGSASTDFALVRYTADGSLDNTFDGDGMQTTDFGFNENATSAAVQADGKIIVAGNSENENSYQYFLVRYNTDGSLDNTFDGDGKQTISFAISLVKLQNDGKILVGGENTLARYNNNGTLDISFNSSGKVSTLVKDFALQNDGKILVLKDDFKVTRYNPDGSLDPTFVSEATDFGIEGDGDYRSPYSRASAIALQSDGKIVAGGFAGLTGRYEDEFYNALVRYNANGSLDYTFAQTGFTLVKFKTFSQKASIAIHDNKIVLAGSLYRNLFYDIYSYEIPAGFGFARVNTNGTLDSTFGTPGINYHGEKVYAEYTTNEDDIQNIVIADNRLYAAGYRNESGRVGLLTRYLLADSNQIPTPRAITITSPVNNAVYLSGGNVYLEAATSDAANTISKVEFYNGATLLYTATDSPYTFKWLKVNTGNYTLTAKAIANNGLVTTSHPVHVSVVPNTPPTISITDPANLQAFLEGGTIHLQAAAQDPDGRITKVEFYNGTTLLATELKLPYTYDFKKVPPGTYTFTAKATDNWGAVTTSAVITVYVVPNNLPTFSFKLNDVDVYNINNGKTDPGESVKINLCDGDQYITSGYFHSSPSNLYRIYAGPIGDVTVLFNGQVADDKVLTADQLTELAGSITVELGNPYRGGRVTEFIRPFTDLNFNGMPDGNDLIGEFVNIQYNVMPAPCTDQPNFSFFFNDKLVFIINNGVADPSESASLTVCDGDSPYAFSYFYSNSDSNLYNVTVTTSGGLCSSMA